MTKRPHTRGGRFLCGALVLGAILLVAGCQRTGTVTGKVSYKGTTLKGGTVTFVTAAGAPKPTGIGDDGSYTVTGVPVGQVKITVDTSALKPQKNVGPPPARGAPGAPKEAVVPGNPAGNTGQPSSMGGGQAPKGDKYVAIPDKYRTQETTDLNYTVTAGSQTHNIDLTD